MTSPSHKNHRITARPAKAKNRSGRWLLASALCSSLTLCSFITLPVVAAEPTVSSSQLKWRPARPALATQSAEPGKIVQTAGTAEISGPRFAPAAPAYNMTAQLGTQFDPAPAFPATPGLTPPAPLNAPGLTPPSPLDAPSTVTPPATISPDSLSQPMPPMTSPGLAPPIPMGSGELPAPNPNNSGRLELDNSPSKSAGDDAHMREDCEQGRIEIKNTGLTQKLSSQIVDLSYTGRFELTQARPYECTVFATNFNERAWGCLTYTWKASALCHKPLYFEEMSLERYGHSWGPILDPAVSAAHFFGTLPILPYKMGVDTPCECQYALGYYRPGNCAPYMIEPFPISPRGAAVQAGFVVGAAAALP